jgi:alkaline phosphatase D
MVARAGTPDFEFAPLVTPYGKTHSLFGTASPIRRLLFQPKPFCEFIDMKPSRFYSILMAVTVMSSAVKCVAGAEVKIEQAKVSASIAMATGFKVTEVTGTTATVWARLTRHSERNLAGVKFGPKDEALPEGRKLADMIDSAVGTRGEVRVIYGVAGAPAKTRTEWTPVVSKADFTRPFQLEGLAPGTTYSVQVEGRSEKGSEATVALNGQFVTPQSKDANAPVSFMAVTGQDYGRRDDPVNGHKIYDHMLKLKPEFFVHTGDVVYYDKAYPWAKTEELAHYKWQATYSLPFQRDFHRNVSSYFMRDDHDTTKNDSWPGRDYGDLTWDRGLEIFQEQTGLPEKLPYRTVRWGRDLQVWMVEGRKYRSPNTMPDGPSKTIWGEKQKQWFYETVQASDATFRVLISPTPTVGPDRKNKNDNHANVGFKHEGDELRAFLAKQKNLYVVCGDRHWQYVSVDPETGVREYACGPTSNKHAGGWKDEYRSPMHKYLKVQGGFLRVEASRKDNNPQLSFRHYDVDGNIANEEVRQAN